MSAPNVCRVVNGRIVKASDLLGRPDCPSMDVDFKEWKHGRKPRARYLARDLQAAESLGQLPNRIAQHVGRRRPTAA